MATVEWQKQIDFGYSTLWPQVIPLSNGGFAVAFVTRGLTLQAQIFDADGAKVGSVVTVGTSLQGAWQQRPNIAQLSDGNIAVFASDIVDPNQEYVFQTRFFYSVLSPDGHILKNGDLRSNDGSMSNSIFFKVESNGTLTAEAGGIHIDGIGANTAARISSIPNGDHTFDKDWQQSEWGTMDDYAIGNDGTGYEAYSTDGSVMVVTKQSSEGNTRPYWGYFQDSDLQYAQAVQGTSGVDTYKLEYQFSQAKFMLGADGQIYIGQNSWSRPAVVATGI